MRSLIASALVFVVAGGMPALAANAPVWQGEAFITAAAAACTTAASGVIAAVGDYYTVVYRPKLSGETAAEGLSFSGGRSMQLFISKATTGELRGTGTFALSGFGSRASAFSGTGSFALTVTPATIVSTTKTIVITGTLTNFYDTAGCTVSVSGSVNPRP